MMKRKWLEGEKIDLVFYTEDTVIPFFNFTIIFYLIIEKWVFFIKTKSFFIEAQALGM